MDVIGYVRVSKEEKARGGVSLEVQQEAIEAAAMSRGWPAPVIIAEDGHSGKDLKRLGIQSALEQLKRGDVLVVMKLDRLTRRMLHLTQTIERAGKEGWALVTLEGDIDMTTPAGEAFAHMLGVFAHLERRLIGQRTKEALAVKAAQGVRLGRPPAIPDHVRRFIREMRAEGHTLRAIASTLEEMGIPTAQGGRWQAGTIAMVLR